GYLVAPPSLHISGERYEWEHKVEPTDVPDWVLELWEEPANMNGYQPASPIGDVIPDGQRNHVLTSLAGSMRHRGMSEDSIAAALLVENDARCDPPLPEDEVRGIANSVNRYTPGIPAIPRAPSPVRCSSSPPGSPRRRDSIPTLGRDRRSSTAATP
ncbi:MAG: primase C-terminal domain-containing protein, partial [Planctomycetes bacterium]|nr:primase C-terminal domain-containing protein [Planctomycetota bacterium]